MKVFWLKGYEATSMTDLMDAMDLHKGSIYKAFGDKRTLFISALRNYMDQGRSAMNHIIESAASPRDAVNGFMNMSLRQCASGDQIKGCFLMNTVVELGPHDDEVRSIISSFMETMRDNLANLIREGQQQGQFRDDRPASYMADYLVSVKAGILTGSKMSMPDQDPFETARFAVSVLEHA